MTSTLAIVVIAIRRIIPMRLDTLTVSGTLLQQPLARRMACALAYAPAVTARMKLFLQPDINTSAR